MRIDKSAGSTQITTRAPEQGISGRSRVLANDQPEIDRTSTQFPNDRWEPSMRPCPTLGAIILEGAEQRGQEVGGRGRVDRKRCVVARLHRRNRPRAADQADDSALERRSALRRPSGVDDMLSPIRMTASDQCPVGKCGTLRCRARGRHDDRWACRLSRGQHNTKDSCDLGWGTRHLWSPWRYQT